MLKQLSAIKDFSVPLWPHQSWLPAQLCAAFGTFKLKYRDNGLIDPRATAKYNISEENRHLWDLAVNRNRGDLIKQQSVLPQYSALVPLILAGIKQYQNVPYSKWSTEGLNMLVPKNLYDAMTCDISGITREDILEAREIGLTIKTGPKMGQVQNATTTWRLSGIKETALGGLPVLAQTMLAQIWVAHPSLRTSYMILDPSNWDNTPDPLINIYALQ